jgi:cytochrome oxidase assembly protein ShyY1
LPWSKLNNNQFNDQWAYQPFELVGKFDHANEVKVHRVKDGIFYNNLTLIYNFVR